MPNTVDRIVDILRGRAGTPVRVHKPDRSRGISGFSIDSRTIRAGSLFVALPGRRADGHRFVAEAFRKGASAALVHHVPPDIHRSPNVLQVPDPLEALQALAAGYRRELPIPVIGVTGSSGKSTTKELIHDLLSQRLRCYRSPGNQNTEIGLPLALLNMPSDAEAAVLELGLQRPGDIRQLARIAQPTHAVITAIGDAHLGFFRDKEELALAKWSLVEHLPQGGTAVVNLDTPFLGEWLERSSVSALGFAIDSDVAQIRARGIRDERLDGIAFELLTPTGSCSVAAPLLGRANVYNVLAAVAALFALGYDVADPAQGESFRHVIGRFAALPHRMELKRSPRFGLIVDDSYNANPASTRASLRALARLEGPQRKVLVFGDMLELGPSATEHHRAMAEEIAQRDLDWVFTVGELTRETARALGESSGWKRQHVAHSVRLRELVGRLHRALPDDRNLIWVKGSRAIGLDQLVDDLVGAKR